MSGEIINVTDADFEAQVINADGPVLVDYSLVWPLQNGRADPGATGRRVR